MFFHLASAVEVDAHAGADWKCKKQDTISKSSSETEYRLMSSFKRNGPKDQEGIMDSVRRWPHAHVIVRIYIICAQLQPNNNLLSWVGHKDQQLLERAYLILKAETYSPEGQD